MPIDFSTDKLREQSDQKENEILKITEEAVFFFKEKEPQVKLVNYPVDLAVFYDKNEKLQKVNNNTQIYSFISRGIVERKIEVDYYHLILYYAFNNLKQKGDDRSIVQKTLKLNPEEFMYFEYGLSDDVVSFSSIKGTPSYFYEVAKKCRKLLLQA
jgi:hypothetical protein